MKLKLRKLFGKLLQFFAFGYSTCGRCNIPWKFVKNHVTFFEKNRGCFSLCESCWQELSIKERLPFYYDLINKWNEDDFDITDKIIEAVLDGK